MNLVETIMSVSTGLIALTNAHYETYFQRQEIIMTDKETCLAIALNLLDHSGNPILSHRYTLLE